MPKIKICAEPGCKNVQTTKGYCRLHFLKNWKRLKDEAQRKAADRLNRDVEGIGKKSPDRYMETIRKDLRGDRQPAVAGEENASRDELDDVLHEMGYPDEDAVDRLLNQLKIDKGF